MTQSAIYPSLKSRHILITGGGSGIGAELTRAFVRQGAHVSFIDFDDQASATLTQELQRETPKATVSYHHCDLRTIPALRATIRNIEAEYGAVRILINNAARDDRHDWRDVTPEYWDERMAINLRPQFFTIQAVAPGMAAAGGGSIINFGSISWKIAQGGMPGYTTAKAAVHGLTRTLARDLGTSGIRVNTIIPGAIMTKRQLDKWISPEDQENIRKSQCLKQSLLPEHLAPMALFLASDDSAQCTAQEFIVDGGWC